MSLRSVNSLLSVTTQTISPTFAMSCQIEIAEIAANSPSTAWQIWQTMALAATNATK